MFSEINAFVDFSIATDVSVVLLPHYSVESCFLDYPEDRNNKLLRNVCNCLQIKTASYTRKI